jgi:riboflavin kinase / FMN adenylyltransferase
VIVVRDGDAAPPGRHSVAVGVFDGLHRGHQRVIAEARDAARGADGVAVATFDPHPAEVLDPARAPLLIATLDQRLEGLAALGVDVARVVTFDAALAAESAESFVRRVLVAGLGASTVVVGEGFRFGHDRAGDVALLARLGASGGFGVRAVAPFGEDGRISATGVRSLLARGDVEAARAMLGHAFTLRGAVERGDARGRQLGYPTANLDVAARQALPAHGVYATLARTADGATHPAATSIGVRPQFYDAAATLVETHLVGFDGDLYGETLDVAFVARLRDEARFSNVNALVAQIGADVEATEQRLAAEDPAALLGWSLGQRR